MPAMPPVQVTSGNKEMWPPPSCQAGLPPVGAPPLTGAHGQPETFSSETADRDPELGPPHSAAKERHFAPERSQPSQPVAPAPSGSGGGSMQTQPAWGYPGGIGVVQSKTTTSSRGSMGMPSLPAAWADHLPAQPAVSIPWTKPSGSSPPGAQPECGVLEAQTETGQSDATQLPQGWANAMDPAQAEAAPESEAASPEHVDSELVETTEPDAGKDEDDALCPEALLKNLKAARKALLWERAVAQRLRKALDMAEAWAPADETAGEVSEVSKLQATIALQKQEIAELQQSAQDKLPISEPEAVSEEWKDRLRNAEESLAGASQEAKKWKETCASMEEKAKSAEDASATIRESVRQLREKLAEAAARDAAMQADQAAAASDASALRDQLRKQEDETASAIRDAVEELREKLKVAEADQVLKSEGASCSLPCKEAASQSAEKKAAEEAAAASDASALRDQLRKQEDETASAIRDAVEELREKLKVAEAASQSAEKKAAEEAAAASDASALRDQLRKQEDETASAIRDAVEELREKLKVAEAASQSAEKKAAEEAAAASDASAVRDQLRKQEVATASAIRDGVGALREKLKVAEAAAASETSALREQVKKLEAATQQDNAQKAADEAAAAAETSALREQVKQLEADSQRDNTQKAADEAAAAAETSTLREQVKQLEAASQQDSAQKAADEAAAAAETSALREQVKQLEADSQRDNTQKAADEAAAAAETSTLREQVKQLEAASQQDSAQKAADEAAAAAETSALREQVKQLEAASQQDNVRKEADEAAAAAETSTLREQVKQLEVAQKASAQEAERSEAQCAGLHKTLLDSEAASENLRQKLRHWEESTDSPEGTTGFEAVNLRHVQAATGHLEKLSVDLRENLRRAGESSADQEASVHDFGVRLRSAQAAAAGKDEQAAEIWAQLRHVEANSESQKLPEALIAKLREIVPDSCGGGSKDEAFQVRLKHVEAAAVETQAASAKLQVQLRHAEASSAHLEDEVQTLRVRLRHVPSREVENAAVQTEPSSSAHKARKTVLFGAEEKQSLPGSVVSEQPEEEELDEDKPAKRREKSRIKSVDFQRAGSAVSYVLESEEEQSASDRDEPMTSRMSTMSQVSAVSEYYDTYNETSQPCKRRSRGRSTLETYDEEDLWDPEHVARITRKLFLKHDKDGTGRIEWSSGEAIKFLEEFFWLHKQPPPKIPKPAFHSLYTQVKMDSKPSGFTDEDIDATGLNVEEMTAFASKVHQFVYKQLGKEMRAQRKSFAISTGDTEVLKQLSKQEAAHESSRRPGHRRATLGGSKLQDLAAGDAEEEAPHQRMTQRRATLGGARLQDAALVGGAEDGEAPFQRLAQRRATRVGVNLREMMAAEDGGQGSDRE
ncbi:unnamed protein product [Symbiodinium sp. CCMP2592]|nr:unnamed protein product [Symbiodinium sp. CCMP2592]